MSAVAKAAEMRGPVETFDGFAHLEVAAIADAPERLHTLLAICDEALEASQAALAARPPEPGERRGGGLLRSFLGGRERDERAHDQALEAWYEGLDALESRTKARVAAWRDAVDAGWLLAATADRDAGLEALAAEGKATREMVDIVRAHPFGDLLLHAALAHD